MKEETTSKNFIANKLTFWGSAFFFNEKMYYIENTNKRTIKTKNMGNPFYVMVNLVNSKNKIVKKKYYRVNNTKFLNNNYFYFWNIIIFS